MTRVKFQYECKIKQIGNSGYLLLPMHFIRTYNLDVNDLFEVTIRKVKEKQQQK